MAENNASFSLVGNFKDNITPSLKKLNTQLASTAKSFEKMQKMIRPIAKDMAIMGDAASRMSSGVKGQRDAFESNLRAMKDYRSELGKISSAQRQMERKFKAPSTPFAPPSIPGGGGGSRPPYGRTPARSFTPEVTGDGFTIEKGILANLATEAITSIFNQITGAFGSAINYVKGAFAERVEDEMGDIQSAGGIFSIGKEKKVAWADTYQEAVSIQESLNAEMAKLAAALPGETGQYVANMKQVTDTTMKVVNDNGPAMIEAMKGFNSSVATQKDAYVEATKQLAKYTTLGSLGATGGVPITALAEQILNMDKVNITSMKRKFAQLQKNPLLSGALEKFQDEMNKASAGSAERYKAMIKAFDQAFPPEVIAAMNQSVDGTFQALKSYLMDPDIGLLGLGRRITMDFSDVGRTLGPAIDKDMTVFKMLRDIFVSFGVIVGPILEILPKVFDPLKTMMQPLKKVFVVMENAQKAVLDATKGFSDKGLDFSAFRGALKGIESIARMFGGADAKEIAKLDQMLNMKNLDFGAAIQQALKVLFSSDALKNFGKAIGEMLSGFLSMLAGMAEKTGEMANQSGLMSGFLEGWRANNGTQALMKIIKDIIALIVKTIVLAGVEALTADPISVAVVATLFIQPLRAKLLQFLGKFFTQVVGNIGKGLTRGAAGLQGPMQTATEQRGMMMGSAIKDSFRGTLAGKAGTRMQQFAQNRMPGLTDMGGKVGGRLAGVGAKFGGLAKNMGALGGGATAITAISGAVDTFSQLSEIGAQEKELAKMRLTAEKAGDKETVEEIKAQQATLAAQKGQTQAGGVGGAVGAVAGGALGAAIAGPIGAMIGSQLGQTLGTTFGPAIGNWWNSVAFPALKGLWTTVSSAFTNAFNGIKSWLAGWGASIGNTITNVKNAIVSAFTNLKGFFANLPNLIVSGLKLAFAPQLAALNFIKDLVSRAIGFLSNLKIPSLPSWLTGKQPGPGSTGGKPKNTPGGTKAKAFGEPGKGFKNLAGAVNYEMANKPPGSDLVIANSSETVIPAAGGYGAQELLTTIQQGFSLARTTYESISQGINTNRVDMTAGFKQSEQKNTERQNATNSRIDKYQSTTQSQIAGIGQSVASLAAKVKEMASMGGMMGGMGGLGGAGGGGAMGGAGTGTGSGYGSGGSKIAGALGTYIKQTGGAPGSIHEHPQHGGVKGKHSPNSYHYQGRAIDIGAYANEQAGVMARIAQFNAKNGVKPVEWLHAKNASGHNDHVHVAYALGKGNPALFSSQKEAVAWEKSMMPGNVRVGSVTGNSAEGFGGSTNVTNNITINQQPGQDPEQLALMVAEKIGEAVSDARLASILV